MFDILEHGVVFIMFRNDNYSFYNSNSTEEQQVKFGSINNYSSFKTINGSVVEGTDKIDEMINSKSNDTEIFPSNSKLFVLSLHWYIGYGIINGITYILYTTIIFFLISLNIIDSSSLLNKVDVSRELKTNYVNGICSFTYSNS